MAVIILLITSNTNLNSQLVGQAKVDSLLSVLSKYEKDTNKVRLLNILSNEFTFINPKKGIEYGEKGLKLAEDIDWELGKGICYDAIGINYNMGLGDAKASLEYYLKALEIFKELEDKALVGIELGSLGNAYLYLADYPKALDYYFKSLKIAEELSDKEGIANINGNIGIIYYNTGKYSKALESFKKSYEIYKELGDKSSQARNLGNMANVYSVQGDIEKSIKYNEEALEIHKENENKPYIAFILGNLGYAYLYSYDYSKAEAYFREAYIINEEMGDKASMAYSLRSLGQIYLELTQDSILKKVAPENVGQFLNKEVNFNKSISYSLEALELSKQMDDLYGLSFIYHNLYEAYKKTNQLDKSLAAFEQFKIIKDSIFAEDKQNKIDSLEKVREDDVNRIKIEKQEILIAAQESERTYIILIAIGVLVAILIILFIIYSQRKKSDKLLYNVLPISIAKRLKKKEHPISDHFDQASIIFIDIVGFTAMSKNSDPTDIVKALNKIFTHYDTIAKKHGLEKIKTIGDCYMAAAGLPVIQKDNTLRATKMALEVRDYMVDYTTDHGYKLDVRIGLDCGPVVAGVIGEQKFIYDMWSDAVNTASRMESTGQPGHVHISEKFKNAVSQLHEFEYIEREEIEVKGKGKMKTYFVVKEKKPSEVSDG